MSTAAFTFPNGLPVADELMQRFRRELERGFRWKELDELVRKYQSEPEGGFDYDDPEVANWLYPRSEDRKPVDREGPCRSTENEALYVGFIVWIDNSEPSRPPPARLHLSTARLLYATVHRGKNPPLKPLPDSRRSAYDCHVTYWYEDQIRKTNVRVLTNAVNTRLVWLPRYTFGQQDPSGDDLYLAARTERIRSDFVTTHGEWASLGPGFEWVLDATDGRIFPDFSGDFAAQGE